MTLFPKLAIIAITIGTMTDAKLHIEAINPKAAPNWLSGTMNVIVAQTTIANRE